MGHPLLTGISKEGVIYVWIKCLGLKCRFTDKKVESYQIFKKKILVGYSGDSYRLTKFDEIISTRCSSKTVPRISDYRELEVYGNILLTLKPRYVKVVWLLTWDEVGYKQIGSSRVGVIVYTSFDFFFLFWAEKISKVVSLGNFSRSVPENIRLARN